ncbi:MAG: hypothetical protein IJJ66_01585 [Treponema sp.]|nr:hypothetical protein [Treponema sp.]
MKTTEEDLRKYALLYIEQFSSNQSSYEEDDEPAKEKALKLKKAILSEYKWGNGENEDYFEKLLCAYTKSVLQATGRE